ncbi:MAG: spore germination protein [Clostridia bacterium]|nr:spore germination protein [Clostridia bacterium]
MNKTFFSDHQKNINALKRLLPAEDIFFHAFSLISGTPCTLVYADGMVNKGLLGELVLRPLENLKFENDGGMDALKEVLRRELLFPELKETTELNGAAKEVLDGNALLLFGDLTVGFIVGTKMLPVRAVTEPPTDAAVKGPREGFIEDVKTNMVLLRKRLKTGNLRMETSRVGKQSDTAVCLCYLEGIVDPNLKTEIERRLQTVELDCVPDSSYIATVLTERKHSIFRSVGTTERPDVFAAKLAEGRVGVLVDGSPIALTVPFALVEDFQAGEDYYISPFMATVYRVLRLIAVVVALILPAFYLSSQLFKIQLLPLGLTLTIVEGTSRLPLSPSMEIFVVLFVFEVLREASVRMPKYVGSALSIVGALVLGEAAVSAGFLSTPTIIVVAVSGICLYTAPNFVETGSLLRWIFLLVGGSLGPFGIVLSVAFVLYYLITADSFNVPPLSPFSPIISSDLKDSIAKYTMYALNKRPRLFNSKNKTRLKRK